MKTLIKKIKSETKNVHIEIPKNFVNKDIRVIIELDENKAEKLLFTDKIKIDTKNWKFDREEIYE
jgi:hypothetical protein